MHTRCAICKDTLDEGNIPMSTLCGHLYCAECATYQFANGNHCAICRSGPYELDGIIRLFPDYELGASRPSSPRHATDRRRRQRERDRIAAGVGVRALNACYGVLENEDVSSSALDNTEDLLRALSDDDAPDIRNLLSNIMSLLQDIRTKAEEAARLPELEQQRDTLQTQARRLTERLRDLQRTRDAEREQSAEESVHFRIQWAARASELQEQLQQATSALNTERAKAEQSKVQVTELDADLKKWRMQAGKYKKKYHALKKEHHAMKHGIEDAFFPGDDSLEII